MKSSVTRSSSESWYKTSLLTLLFFVLIVTVSEMFLRGGWVQARVNVPYPTQGYRSADDAFRALDKFIKETGKVDCIFLGSSLVAVGINPSVFEEAYQNQTGEAITCFNFGVSVATASSMGPLAHILVDNYHPKLLVFATAPRAFVERASTYEPEEKFQYTPWAQYHLGRFSLAGWALEHLYVARYLAGLSGILFGAGIEETGNNNGQAEHPIVVAKGTPGNYAPLLYFNTSAPLYLIKNNVNVTRQKISLTYEISDEDFSGFKQIVELGRESGLILVVVEMPSPKYFFADPAGAPEPSEQTVFYQAIAGYARQQGVPFWLTTELNLIPYTYFSDASHLYNSGALDFSQWLGKEVGAALVQGNLGGGIAEEYIDQPPLQDLEIRRDYLATRGLSSEYIKMYQEYLSQFDLVPSGAVILNPLQNGLDPDFVQTILGFYIQGDVNINVHNVDDWFALMAAQDRMVTISEAMSLPKKEQALNNWFNSLSPDPLIQAGFDYLLITENWDDPNTSPLDTPLDDPGYYRLVKDWEYAPLRETYYLYQLLH